MEHIYRVGQILDLQADPGRSNRPAGPCEVMQCLPHDRGPLLYRIKSWTEGVERVVQEHDLRPSQSEKPAAAASFSPGNIAVSTRRRS